MIAPNELQKDAIVELLNIAIGHAASVLNEMVDDEITLSVPSIDFIDRTTAATRLHQGELSVAVRQTFTGSIAGDVLLIFPERKSLELVRTILGDVVPLDVMTDLEQDALLEVGNVILNACIGSLANQLGREIESALPIFCRGSSGHVLGNETPEAMADDIVLFLRVDFALTQRQIFGYLAFVMDITAADAFLAAVDAYLSRVLPGGT